MNPNPPNAGDGSLFISTPPTSFDSNLYPEISYFYNDGDATSTLEACVEYQILVCGIKLDFLDVLLTITYDLEDECVCEDPDLQPSPGLCQSYA